MVMGYRQKPQQQKKRPPMKRVRVRVKFMFRIRVRFPEWLFSAGLFPWLIFGISFSAVLGKNFFMFWLLI